MISALLNQWSAVDPKSETVALDIIRAVQCVLRLEMQQSGYHKTLALINSSHLLSKISNHRVLRAGQMSYTSGHTRACRPNVGEVSAQSPYFVLLSFSVFLLTCLVRASSADCPYNPVTLERSQWHMIWCIVLEIFASVLAPTDTSVPSHAQEEVEVMAQVCLKLKLNLNCLRWWTLYPPTTQDC